MPSFNLFGKRKAAQKSKVIKAENERLKREKITIYPTPEQVNKLYELIEDFRKRTGVRINQQDLIRRLIDSADSKTVLPYNTVFFLPLTSSHDFSHANRN